MLHSHRHSEGGETSEAYLCMYEERTVLNLLHFINLNGDESSSDFCIESCLALDCLHRQMTCSS